MNHQLSDRFGLAVRLSREERGWSQELLAEMADINRSYLGEVERGEAVPSLLTIAKLAQGLGVSMTSLIGRCESQRLS
jgi:XRE family transcriptional regulator, regulator of sulfur utilization